MLLALADAGAIGGDSTTSAFAGLEFAAQLVNELPPELAETLLDELDDLSEEMSKRIREAMFTFEDLGRLANRELQLLLREVSSDDLAIALRTAGETLREAFFGAMSSRAAQTLREDIEIMPPKRLTEVEAAQRAVVDIAMQMAGEGRLQLPGKSGEEMV
jgi:flagellar motor switch protein FliG